MARDPPVVPTVRPQDNHYGRWSGNRRDDLSLSALPALVVAVVTRPAENQQTVEALRPESCYFGPEGGQRTAYFFFDMKDSSQMPAIAEPWYLATNALIDIQPVMNADELRAGLEKIPR